MTLVGVFGSVILMFINTTGIVIGTDSLVNRSDGGTPTMGCKLVQVRQKVIFGATGIGRFQQPVFDPYRLAVEVGAAQSMAAAARDYQTRAATTVKQIWRDIRSSYLRFGGFQERGDGSLDQSISPHSYVFAGIDKDGAVVAAGGKFTEHPGHAGTLVFEEFEVRIKKDSDVFFWPLGMHNAIPDVAGVSRLINSVGGPEAIKQLAELQIRTTPRLVGPPVSVLVVSASDNNSWHSAGACGWKP